MRSSYYPQAPFVLSATDDPDTVLLPAFDKFFLELQNEVEEKLYKPQKKRKIKSKKKTYY
jgi:hypothetical protein